MNVKHFVKDGESVEAIQWHGDISFPEEFSDLGWLEHENGYDLEVTAEDGHKLCRLDSWIVKDSKGRYYVYADEDFRELFQPQQGECGDDNA